MRPDQSAEVDRGPCPSCLSRNVVRILYGEPQPVSTLEDDLHAGRVVLGGCIVSDAVPDFRCQACGHEFGGAAMSSEPSGHGAGEIPATTLPPAPRPGSWAVGRLVLAGSAASRKHEPDRARLLELATDELARQQASVRYLLTPAGFLRVKLAPGLGLSHGWDTSPEDFDALAAVAKAEALKLVSGALRRRLRRVAEYLVLGVDVAAPKGEGKSYAETAIVIDLAAGTVVGATGKTYPNSDQQSHLIRNCDASNHLMMLGDDRVAVLVCHDLIAFGKRSATNRGERRAGVADKLATALAHDPAIILHLPHTVDRAATWSPSWKRLARRGKATPVWASAIKYRCVGDEHRPKKPFHSELLDAMSSGHDDVLDIVLGDYVPTA